MKYCLEKFFISLNIFIISPLDAFFIIHSITCIQKPPEGSNTSDLLQQVVFKCRSYLVNLSGGVVSEQWSLTAEDCLIQVVSNTALTVTSNSSNPKKVQSCKIYWGKQ